MGNKLRSLFSDYGMFGVLLLLCLVCSLATISPQQPTDRWTADRLAAKVAVEHPAGNAVVVGLRSDDEGAFVNCVEDGLKRRGVTVLSAVSGPPGEIEQAIRRAIAGGQRIDVVVSSLGVAEYPILNR